MRSVGCGASSLLDWADLGQMLLPDQLLAMWARSSLPPPRCSVNCHPAGEQQAVCSEQLNLEFYVRSVITEIAERS